MEVEVGGHPIALLRPESSEALISEADFERDERLPYWAELWPSALILARHIAGLSGAKRTLLELGCGVGLVAVAASQAEFQVTATDYYSDALLFAGVNVARNTGQEIAVRELDWRAVPEDLGRFDVVVASDVLYERAYPALIAAAIARTLKPNGVALLADPGRVAAPDFPSACAEVGLAVRDRIQLPFSEGEIRQVIDVSTIGWDESSGPT